MVVALSLHQIPLWTFLWPAWSVNKEALVQQEENTESRLKQYPHLCDFIVRNTAGHPHCHLLHVYVIKEAGVQFRGALWILSGKSTDWRERERGRGDRKGENYSLTEQYQPPTGRDEKMRKKPICSPRTGSHKDHQWTIRSTSVRLFVNMWFTQTQSTTHILFTLHKGKIYPCLGEIWWTSP